MKKTIITALCLLCTSGIVMAQSKVFKEVSEDMKSTMELIIQNDQLVGYLRFTQLEKARGDSFNYRIDIMDENLNDIGTVKFRDEQIHLQSVAFEQDVLCLAYLKSNIIGTEFKNRRQYKRSLDEADNYITTQFITLDGKILKTNAYKVAINLDKDAFATQYYGNYRVVFTQFIGYGNLEHPVQVANVPNKGFVCFYGDADNNYLMSYNPQGKELWQKKIPEVASGYTLHASNEALYLLAKKGPDEHEGGFELKAFKQDGTQYRNLTLKDSVGNSLKVLAINNDPATGKAYLTGNILNPRRVNTKRNAKALAQGSYMGVFSMELEGTKPATTYSYWNDGSKMPNISKKGYSYQDNAYPWYSRSFKDYEGNTYFAGTAYDKKTRVGTIITAVILSPLVFYSPYLLYAMGTKKSSMRSTAILKQDKDGVLKWEKSIPGNKARYYPSKAPIGLYNNRSIYHVANSNTRTNYLVVDDTKDITVYNIEQKKVARVIPHKQGALYYSMMPAKEGHVLVTQYDAKAKSTRYSIETL